MKAVWLASLCVVFSTTAWAQPASTDPVDDEPLVADEPESAALPQAQRRKYELSARDNPYAITPHRPNYLIPISYSHRPHGSAFGSSDNDLDHFEVKFQLSFKVSAWESPFKLPADLFFAYTGRSFWQAYNRDFSSPFRDTNHEPEIFLATHGDWTLGALRDLDARVGFSHQSNGQALPLSRSWNRIYVGVNGRWRNFFADAQFWHRIPEKAKSNPNDPKGDDNPDIERTVGNAEFTLAWVIGRKSVNLNWRNNLRRDNKGAVTAALTFPLNSRMKGYLEIFSGYGETLIDYDRSNERIGVGIALSDWL